MIWLHPRFIYPFQTESFSDPRFEAVEVAVPDGSPVIAYVARGGAAQPVVLFFMGNVGSLAYFRPMLDPHLEAGRSVIAMTYRGGGGQPGHPSETGLKRDALALADHAAAAFPDKPVFVQGYSLGTGLAVHVAARRPVDGVVLSAPYDALCRLMRKRSGLPACWLPVQKWRRDADVGKLRAPVLIQHGTADRLVPFVSGSTLASKMTEAGVAVRFHAIRGAVHNDLTQFPDHQATIDRFINGLR